MSELAKQIRELPYPKEYIVVGQDERDVATWHKALAAAAKLAADYPIAARLKKPEWVEGLNEHGLSEHCFHSVVGTYEVVLCDEGWRYAVPGRVYRLVEANTLEAAKAACEADYTRRIMEAFE